jgi:hypothetical protein
MATGPGSNLSLEPSEPQGIRSISPPTLVYWTRLGFAVLAGVLYNVLGLRGQDVLVGTSSAISMGIGIYAISVFVVKYILHFGPNELKGPNKHITLGIGSYIIWFLFTTILLNTIINPSPS